jgi:hypothetical protein
VVHERLHGSSFPLALSLARAWAGHIGGCTDEGCGFSAVR